MGMVAEEDQPLKGLINHLCEAFQSGDTLSELISDFLWPVSKDQKDRRHLC